MICIRIHRSPSASPPTPGRSPIRIQCRAQTSQSAACPRGRGWGTRLGRGRGAARGQSGAGGAGEGPEAAARDCTGVLAGEDSGLRSAGAGAGGGSRRPSVWAGRALVPRRPGRLRQRSTRGVHARAREAFQDGWPRERRAICGEPTA